ncbi:DUF4328 domain-containing protein [Streptosporangiaceae bacterium NEAU-GS5]|nr:DUF4328 domain-containing protein [Streptosporangiaceae bacterium NEAU-GS5]
MRIAGGPAWIGRSALCVYVSLAVQVAALVALVVFEETRGQRLARQIAVFHGDPQAPGARAVVGAVTVFAVVMMVVVLAAIASAASYLSWLRRICQEVDSWELYRRRARGDGGVPAVWAAWLIPVVNLVAPPLLLLDVWREVTQGRDAARRTALVAGWWLSWLVTLWLVFVRLPLREVAPGADLTGFGLPELAAAAVAAALCALTVRDLTRAFTPTLRHPRPLRVILQVFPAPSSPSL